MATRQLARMDLNLLLTLQVLLECHSVSAAARQLNLTQSAISKALGRLRAQFNDPLFLRASKGLVPTPFALRLQQPLHDWLETANGLFMQEDFDPATWKGELTLAAHEYLHVTLVPGLLARLRERAPGMRLKVHSHYTDQLKGLELGDIDFALNLEFSDLSHDFDSEVMFTDTPAILARTSHPLRRKAWTRDDLLRYPRIALRVPDAERFTMFRPRSGQPPLSQLWPAAYETDDLTVALATVSRTDCLLLAGGILNGLTTRDLGFRPLDSTAPPPFKLAYCLVSHRRVQRSAPHQWLKGAIGELFQTLRQADAELTRT
ncbi:MAG TPA: LysR family transcriptional regulator [Steroidobacteraceae bacterium]|jgi:DNA-binding transcriptional LysR family regulator|nr:LysR family transcriptional regulator [Steroidobacteraceae bacterium]